jgi:hypothetical protein
LYKSRVFSQWGEFECMSDPHDTPRIPMSLVMILWSASFNLMPFSLLCRRRWCQGQRTPSRTWVNSKTVCVFITVVPIIKQAHRETTAHFTADGMSSQRNQSDSFRFKRAAFYQSMKSKVGLAAAKAAALRINLNVEGCGIVAAPVHAPSRAPLLLPLLLSHNLPLPRVH